MKKLLEIQPFCQEKWRQAAPVKKKKRNNGSVVPLFIRQVVSLILSIFHAVTRLFLCECDNLVHIFSHPLL